MSVSVSGIVLSCRVSLNFIQSEDKHQKMIANIFFLWVILCDGVTVFCLSVELSCCLPLPCTRLYMIHILQVIVPFEVSNALYIDNTVLYSYYIIAGSNTNPS